MILENGIVYKWLHTILNNFDNLTLPLSLFSSFLVIRILYGLYNSIDHFPQWPKSYMDDPEKFPKLIQVEIFKEIKNNYS